MSAIAILLNKNLRRAPPPTNSIRTRTSNSNSNNSNSNSNSTNYKPMKNIIASILLVAAVCATGEAQRTPKSVATIKYAGTKCNTTPTSVLVYNPAVLNTTCTPKSCHVGGDLLTTKEDCVSGNSDDYVETILKEFKKSGKKSGAVLTVNYGDWSCSGKPVNAYGFAANNGACVNYGTYTVNKDRSMLVKFYDNAECKGAASFEDVRPADTTTGRCLNGVRTFALRDVRDKLKLQ